MGISLIFVQGRGFQSMVLRPAPSTPPGSCENVNSWAPQTQGIRNSGVACSLLCLMSPQTVLMH